jgi:hypothetical protein
MVKSIKNLKNNKLSKRLRKSKRSASRKNVQRGGVASSACVLPYTNDTMSYRSIGAGADIHNTNPQASLDLDNKFMMYGGPVRLGQMGGSSKCGDEGVGTSHPKSETFKTYLNNLDNQLSMTGGSNCGSRNGVMNNMQKGAGYTFDPASNIAGNPQVIGYPDNNPPAIIDSKLIMGSVDGSLCGNGATRGGSRKNKSRKHKSLKHKSRKNKSRKHKSKLQKGGDFVGIGSKPAEFATAFDGPKGLFKYPDDMMGREFGERQPNYSVNAI